jgi:hypothetical protein
MSWFSKQDESKIPENLKGKTSEEIVKELQEAAQVRTDLEKVRTDAATAATAAATQAAEFEQVRAKLVELEAAQAAAAAAAQPPGLTSFLVDEDKAFAERAAPLASMAYNSAAATARMLARDRLRTESKPGGLNLTALYDKYSAEIDELAKQVPIVQQVHPQTWVNLFDLIKGRHALELVEATKKGENWFLVEPVGGGAPPGKPPEDKELTPEQLKIAAKFKMTPEDYKKRQKELTYVTG